MPTTNDCDKSYNAVTKQALKINHVLVPKSTMSNLEQCTHCILKLNEKHTNAVSKIEFFIVRLGIFIMRITSEQQPSE